MSLRRPNADLGPVPEEMELTLKGNKIMFRGRVVGRIVYVPPRKGKEKAWYAIDPEGVRTDQVSFKVGALILFYYHKTLPTLF